MSFSNLGGFASGLINSINEQANLGNNPAQSLDTTDPNDPSRVIAYGSLGDYADKIDKSAQRSYVESGYIRNIRPREREILMQQPELTVIVKKRMFSSLVENFQPELMDAQEKLFYRAAKRIFQNKCDLISAYERLTKIENIITGIGVLSNDFLPVVFSGLDALDAVGGGSLVDSGTRSTLDALRALQNFSTPLYSTTWLVNGSTPGLGDLGDGTGAFELTMVSNVSTTSSVNLNGGSCSFSVEDPYRLMIVTPEDIDQAVRQSVGSFVSNQFFTLTKSTLQQTILDLKNQLHSERSQRGANDIIFSVNESSILYSKVRAVIDGIGFDIKFNYNGGLLGIGSSSDLDASATSSDLNGQELQSGEVNIFNQIVSSIYQYIALESSTDTSEVAFDATSNLVRRKLLLHFGNQPIIQPMDVVSVFISSQTLLDPRISMDLNESFGLDDILSGISSTIDSINSLFGSASGKPTPFDEAEKNAIAGPDFPMWLWNMMKTNFTAQNAGTHVFGGFVQSANHKYSPGKYSLEVNCTDNAGYFKLGVVNLNPSQTSFNSTLYDPLTPFQSNFDLSTGFQAGKFPILLQENIDLLNTGVVKLKNGRFRGQPASQEVYQGLDNEKFGNGYIQRLQDPDGFVYRWKEGIQSLTYRGPTYPSSLGSLSSPAMTQNPFAGQDVLNVLSMLITGQPYNFNNFMRGAMISGTITRDDLANDSGAKSFFKGLLAQINTNNSIWGNFFPFKKLIVNESAYTFLQSGQLDVSTQNDKLKDLLKQRATRFDSLVKIFPQFANNPQYLNVNASGVLVNASFGNAVQISGSLNNSVLDTANISKLGQSILDLDLQIQEAQAAFVNSINNSNISTTDGNISIIGDDISFESSITDGNSLTQSDITAEREQLRESLNFLTQRRLWKVKANSDQNLFIVDDQYDKNYDIQAFSRALIGQMELFKTNYVDVASQIQSVKDTLGLEVFADSQGHIQVRPPQYNKMPSSVFYNMLDKASQTGVQIFPDYLQSLFTNLVDGLSSQIEVLEDEIRIRTAVLGYVTDSASAGILSAKLTINGPAITTKFSFVTDESTGMLGGGTDIRNFLDQSNPDLTDSSISGALTSLNAKLSSLNLNAINFDAVQRTNLVNQVQFGNGVSPQDINSRISTIGQRLQGKTGQPSPTKATLLSTTNIANGLGVSQLDVLNVTNQISQFLSQRQTALKQLVNATKNLTEGVTLNQSAANSPATQNILSPFISKQKQLPSIIEHMLEDDTNDDYGVGSGQRFIIKEHQILSLNVQVNPPQHTMIEVTGLPFGQGIVSPDSGFDIDGGNLQSTAWAVDFDMWRMYGFRGSQPISAPFLSDPDSQCAPYAVFMLNLARKNILQGSVTIAGNEYIQPGEVYYLEDRDLLFYAESVQHNFSYKDNFTTTITLKYGHNPGEYIPSILDIIGKALYTNKNKADIVRHDRIDSSSGDQPLIVLSIDNRPGNGSVISDPIGSLISGSYGDQNRKQLANLLLICNGLLAPTTLGSTATLEVRVYHSGGSPDSGLINCANSVIDYLKNPTKFSSNQDVVLPDNANTGSNSSINSSNLIVVGCDLSDQTQTVSPSGAAWNRAREVASTSGTASVPGATPNGNVAPQLYSNVIDIWLTFSNPTNVQQVTSSSAQQANQAAQENLAQAKDQFNQKVQSIGAAQVVDSSGDAGEDG